MLRAGGKTAHHGRYLFFFTLAGLLAFAEEAWAKESVVKEAARAVPAPSLSTTPRNDIFDPAKADIRKNLIANHSSPRRVAEKSSTRAPQAPDVEFTTAMRHLARIPLNDKDKNTPFTLGFKGRYLHLSIGW